MPTVKSLRPAVAASLAVIGLSVFAGCSSSFDYATDRPNVLAHGGYGTTGNGQIRVAAAVIVASAPNTGTFSATITLAPSQNAATISQASIDKQAFTGLAVAAGTTKVVKPTAAFSYKVDSIGSVNLASPLVGGVALTGTFQPGDIIPITLTFADATFVTIEVPVVKQCGEYAGIGPFNAAKAKAFQAAQAKPEAESPEPSYAASPGLYQCAYSGTPGAE